MTEATYKEQTIEHALGRIVDINTRRPEVGRDGWVRWRVQEYFPADYPAADKADRVRVCHVTAGRAAETFLHWPTLCAMIGDGSAVLE
jgi:hypothetical protein